MTESPRQLQKSGQNATSTGGVESKSLTGIGTKGSSPHLLCLPIDYLGPIIRPLSLPTQFEVHNRLWAPS
jgi:hypothetical protein